MPKSKDKWVMLKQVTISVLVAKQKQGKLYPPKQECGGKDGRKIGVRSADSSGFGKKEQKWTEEATTSALW